MDNKIDLKKKIHDFIEHADERILKVFYAIVTSEENHPSIPQSFYQELDKRKERYLNGESKSYTWEDVKNRARNKFRE